MATPNTRFHLPNTIAPSHHTPFCWLCQFCPSHLYQPHSIKFSPPLPPSTALLALFCSPTLAPQPWAGQSERPGRRNSPSRHFLPLPRRSPRCQRNLAIVRTRQSAILGRPESGGRLKMAGRPKVSLHSALWNETSPKRHQQESSRLCCFASFSGELGYSSLKMKEVSTKAAGTDSSCSSSLFLSILKATGSVVHRKLPY
jgi:hypothetical protein